MSRDTAVVRTIAGRCLQYPDAAFHEALPLMRSAAEDLGNTSLRAFLDHAAATAPQRLAEHYVQVFDFKNRRCLYLSWWTDGDTRRRGMSLVGFKEAYRRHGLEFTGEELPDFLPVVLEFAATTGDAGLLVRHRPALELIRFSLTEGDTPYRHLLEAVCATLPGPSPKDQAQARAMARGGPPREDVGLEPYGLLPLLTGEPR